MLTLDDQRLSDITPHELVSNKGRKKMTGFVISSETNSIINLAIWLLGEKGVLVTCWRLLDGEIRLHDQDNVIRLSSNIKRRRHSDRYLLRSSLLLQWPRAAQFHVNHLDTL